MGTRQSPHCPLQGDRLLWLSVDVADPAPRSTGIVLVPCAQEAAAAGRGCTATLGNFTKATLGAISKTYSYLIPDLWKETMFTKSPYQEFTDHLVKKKTSSNSISNIGFLHKKK